MLRLRAGYSAKHEPRMEMTPLLDVIFLLLTFFIYSIVLTVRAQVLPVSLPALTTGQTAQDVKVAGITVDARGDLFLNRQPVTRQELEARLGELSRQPEPPAFYLAIDAEQGQVDRGPLLIELIELLRKLKIENVNIVGAPGGTGEANPK
jgi:biopolymer transport protein ExbD